MSACSHVASAHARRWAPVVCEQCRGFVDQDGSVISASVARARYPTMTTLIDPVAAKWSAQDAQARHERTFWFQADRMVGLFGKIAWQLTQLAFALAALAVIIFLVR